MAETQHQIERTPLGLYTIRSPYHRDHRGYFHEVAALDQVEKATGLDFRVSQVSVARSETNVLRGQHAEYWDKIIYVASGIAFLAWADIRLGSKTFGQVENMTMSDADRCSVLVPRGFANSLYVLNGPVVYLYCTNARYDGTDQTAVAWDDPDLNIKWPGTNPILSKKDQNNPTLRQIRAEAFA